MVYFILVIALFYLSREAYRLRYHFAQVHQWQFAEGVLSEKIPYYSWLSATQRKKFLFRVDEVRKEKHFVAMEDMVLTDEHEILISAMLVMVTFGYRGYYTLPAYEVIKVYPSTFYSRLVDAEVKGLTISNIGVLMSWDHVKDGIDDPSNKVNLAIHEFAHAFKLQYSHFNYNFKWEFWYLYAEELMEQMRLGNVTFFRDYGANNINEFWAVSLEAFFEQPAEFKQHFPRLYACTAKLLKQDPCKLLAQSKKS